MVWSRRWFDQRGAARCRWLAAAGSPTDADAQLDRKSRTWPNTERLRAAVAMFELDGRDPRPVFGGTGGLLLRRYLSRAPRGTWIDEFEADGSRQMDRIPASTLYHLFLAFAEMLRVQEAVKRGFPASAEITNMDSGEGDRARGQ